MLAAMLMAAGAPAQAHRLDEYLQATTIALARQGITLRLRLTPGMDVAQRVIGQIDRNGDGILSPGEQQGYAQRIAGALSLSLNGQSLALHPRAGAFPGLDALKGGAGVIDIVFDVKTALGNGPYRLAYRNGASSLETVWLVNCLLPQDASIHILQQKRSKDQSVYQLDFRVDDRKSIGDAAR
ncbi:hypothetical protein ACMAUO_00580 [Gluconacetobacter sp. Hr-1-5]|uniref:hypothetical protein n=1 Tax=Gluconacetobacter sp. Hr-1-5 TaxID=3395370 RepID=UPI003B524A74